MISYIKGVVKFIDDNSVSVLANDVGWNINVYVPEKYLIDSEVEFYVYSHFRESEISLWGFESVEQLKCFKMLISVSGVGPRTAQSLIGDRGVAQIKFSILNNDEKTLRVPGVGLKTSQKIIIELKTKITKLGDTEELTILSSNNTFESGLYRELTDALSSLGYRNYDIQEFITKLDDDSKNLSTEDLIKKFLRSA